MDKRALTSYDTVCWPDRLSFAQEMRESQLYVGVYIAEPGAIGHPDTRACQGIIKAAHSHVIKDRGLQAHAAECPCIRLDPIDQLLVLHYPLCCPRQAFRQSPTAFGHEAIALLKNLQRQGFADGRAGNHHIELAKHQLFAKRMILRNRPSES